MTNRLIVECKAEQQIAGNTLSGLAHVFGQRAKIGAQYEVVERSAFDAALETSDVRAFYQHDQRLLLGRQSTGTLRLHVGKVGLEYELDLPNTSYANDLRELVARGDLNEMSFGFIPDKVRWSKAPDGVLTRSHVSVRELVDISPVSIPAFGGTSIQMRGKSFNDESLRSQLVRARSRVMKLKERD